MTIPVRTYRLDTGSVVIAQVHHVDPDATEAIRAVLATLGVSVLLAEEGFELTILTGPGHPIEIGNVAVAR